MNWKNIANNWAYLYFGPPIKATLKSKASDFKVVEVMGFDPSGKGEHVWLRVRKQYQNTLKVAKALAQFSHVAYRHVGYSGMKDYHALTEQWFSVLVHPNKEPDWGGFEFEGCDILQVVRHDKKLKIGTHRENKFEVRLRDYKGDIQSFTSIIDLIERKGIANYFGNQRFGNDFSNLDLAHNMLIKKEKVKSKSMQSLAISAMRSWLFNVQLSHLIQMDKWEGVQKGEVLCLNQSNSFFIAQGDEQDRIEAFDCHPSCAMWGALNDKDSQLQTVYDDVLEMLFDYHDYCHGLEQAGLRFQPRPVRMQVHDLHVEYESNDIVLRFKLARGQFATSVLRELLQV